MNPNEIDKTEHEAALEDEELTMEKIRAQAKSHAEPTVEELATSFRAKLHLVLFEVRTPAGKAVNFFILSLIVAVVFSSMIATLEKIPQKWVQYIQDFEVFVLYVFLLEFVARFYAAKHRWDYLRSYNGIIDFLTILPLFLSGNGLVAVRLLRLLRLVKITTFFPILKSLFVSVSGAMGLLLAVLGTISLISLLVGNLIYLIEPETFRNAFEGLWWSLVTMSTVGYGDLVPHTVIGKVLGGFLILTGILMFAMVTAVISVRVGVMVHMNSTCVHCDKSISPEYRYCPFCGGDQSDDVQLF